MNKTEEITAWKAFALSLPVESYSRSFAILCAEQIESAIRADMMPEHYCLTPNEASQRASEIINSAIADGEKLKSFAEKEADSKRALIERYRDEAWNAMRKVERALQDL